MEFREQLMELRKQRGWSQEQLGAKIGVTRQTVSKWETGDTTPELAKLIELSSLFEISVDRLIGIEEPRIRRLYIFMRPDGIMNIRVKPHSGDCRWFILMWGEVCAVQKE